ncbi:heterokaryon incompatibility protein-domain-containing protein [Hypoxylon sp. FL1284]|nr:heterokaryon incompatibility protein-domain-containing protein [Hypoxylon sp. FL1284]
MSDSSDTCRSEEEHNFESYRSVPKVIIESHDETDNCSHCFPKLPPARTTASDALSRSLSLCHTCAAQKFENPLLINRRLPLDQVLREEDCRFCRLIAYCVLNDKKLKRRVFRAKRRRDFEVYFKCSRIPGNEQIFLCIGKAGSFEDIADRRDKHTGKQPTEKNIDEMVERWWGGFKGWGDYVMKHSLWMTPGAGIPFWVKQVDYGDSQETWARIRSGVSYSIQLVDHLPWDFVHGKPVEVPIRASFAQLKGKGALFTPPPNPRYLALSYVWGTGNTLLLKKDNYDEFHTEGASREELVPKTIHDAMVLCSNLGERYLWVDALCIIQDGSDDKMEQINAMDAIYSRAHVTIVAAEADGANGGLAPVNGSRVVRYLAHDVDSRMMVAKICPQAVTTPTRLGRLIWATRAWTFQDRVEDIFFDDQVMSSRSSTHTHEVSLPLTSLPTTNASSNDFFSSFLSQYLMRNMTDQSDILKAFTGVLNSLQPQFGPSHYGMPTRFLDASLGWRFISHKSRAQWYTADDFHHAAELPARREGLPSWT